MSQNEQTLVADIAGTDFSFTVKRDDYNKYINSVTQNNKVAPSHNFLMTTVDEKQKASLKQLLASTPGAEVQIASAVLEEYTPDLAIVVKKSSSVQAD